MKVLNRVFILLSLIIFFLDGYSQFFPPPENLQIILQNEKPLLIWEAPSKELNHYNIYRNNILISSSTNLQFTDTIQFIYYNEWHVTAVYVNPNGESGSSNTVVLGVPLIEQIPYLENFDHEVAIWRTLVQSGQTEWHLVDSISFSGYQSASCYSAVYGNQSILHSPDIYGDQTGEIELSFWYKCPVENNLSDELKVYRYNWQDTVLLSDVLTNQNQWTQKKILLGDIDEFNISFESLSVGGNGVFIDSISITETLTTVENKLQLAEMGFLQITPNPVKNGTTIKYYLPHKDNIKLSLFDINGRLIRNFIEEELPEGVHEINFVRGGLPSGIYFVFLETKNKSLVNKIILK